MNSSVNFGQAIRWWLALLVVAITLMFNMGIVDWVQEFHYQFRHQNSNRGALTHTFLLNQQEFDQSRKGIRAAEICIAGKMYEILSCEKKGTRYEIACEWDAWDSFLHQLSTLSNLSWHDRQSSKWTRCKFPFVSWMLLWVATIFANRQEQPSSHTKRYFPHFLLSFDKPPWSFFSTGE